MIIEWLKFKVKPELREKFVQNDEEIWTEFLLQQDGHLGKEVWIDPVAEDEVIAISQWQTFEQWKAIAQSLLDDTEARFRSVMGQGTYELVEAKAYQVRKFADRSGNE
jgi:uncharacterized protein (TIGR03792 family)